MAWARMDDGFHDHPKVGRLSLAAVGLWTLCFTWCNRHLGADDLPPGFIPTHQPKRFGGTTKQIGELVDAGLWETADGGWLFHDFEDYLPATKAPATAAEVKESRRQAGRKGAESRWQGHDKPNGKLLPDTDGKPMAPVPSRPVPDVSSDDDTGGRPDIDAICTHLADQIEANGSKRPTITNRWRTSARLLIDVDGRTPDQVRAAIDWCQHDEFWRGVVLSMPKLREKYDQLRLAATRSQGRPGDRQIDNLRDAMAWAQQHDAQTTATTPPAIGA